MKKLFDLAVCLSSGIVGISVFLFYLGRRQVVIVNEEDRVVFSIKRIKEEYFYYDTGTKKVHRTNSFRGRNN